jgi:hypothetical protein
MCCTTTLVPGEDFVPDRRDDPAVVGNEVARFAHECARDPHVARRRTVIPYRAPVGLECETHQFLLMIKPEGLDVAAGVRVSDVFALVEEQLDRLHVRRHAVALFSSTQLRRDRILEAHYGVLNRVAHEGLRCLSPGTMKRLQIYCRSHGTPTARVVGAFELLEADGDFSPRSLETLCRNVETTKLGAGVYAVYVLVDGAPRIILNAFHPQQLESFHRPGGAFAFLECRSELGWQEIRSRLVGDTNPWSASPGTLRRSLLQSAERLGLSSISIGRNAVHVSPGPVEGMLAMVRYFLDGDGRSIEWTETAFGAMLRRAGWERAESVPLDERMVRNASGDLVPLLEATEDMSWRQALIVVAASGARPADFDAPVA